MAAFEYINSKWQELRKRMTKGLAAAFATSTLMIAACVLLAPGEEGPYVCSVIVTVALTLASSVFAACVISFMFDLKSIRNLIVRNDVNLLLRMLLRSDELFTTDGNSGSQHDVILRNLRLKATSALNGIDLNIDDPKGSSTDLKEGHVLACLSSLDQQLDSAYAKYVNIRRIVRDEGDGSFSIHETTYIRLYNDTETPKTIRAWNYLRSASIPATCSNPQRDTLQEHVTVTVNEGVPKRYDYSYPCEISDLQGIDTASRRWKCQWDEELRATQVRQREPASWKSIEPFSSPRRRTSATSGERCAPKVATRLPLKATAVSPYSKSSIAISAKKPMLSVVQNAQKAMTLE